MKYMTADELKAHPSVFATHDVPYIPVPNVVDVLITDQVAPTELNPTAFIFAFLPDGSLVLANNVKRGGEVCGGHIDPGETADIAAIREGREEAGIRVGAVAPIGIFRSHTTGLKPEPGMTRREYPHPVSTQQFFVGIVELLEPYKANAESHGPLIVPPESAERTLKSKEFVLYKHAMATLFPEIAVEQGFVERQPKP